MCETQKYPIGVQNFEKIILENYLYVDKTDLIYKLIEGSPYYFLSRPRRFGKSLFLSTLEAFFLGKKELFRGLSIDRHDDIEWKEYPVFHLDFNVQNYAQDEESLDQILDNSLRKWEKLYDVTYNKDSYSLRFARVIQAAYEKTGCQVVILIDEYDRPLMQNINNGSLQDLFRNTLKGFFGVLKSCDQYIKFGFLTGVTKFGRVSVFSDLNNLQDLTMEPDFNAICGITESEMLTYMRPGIEQLAEKLRLGFKETCVMLKSNYDGYRFSEEETEGIYNPYSLLNVLKSRRFTDYWFMTGTPTLLIDLLRNSRVDIADLEGATRTEIELSGIDTMRLDPVPLLFQTGYLTIKGTFRDGRRTKYRLGFPNEEVESGFMDALLPYYVNTDDFDEDFNISSVIDALRENRVDDFMEMMKSLMAGVPYNESGEKVGDKVYENRLRDVVFIICRLMGMSVEAECHTNRGRIDMTVKTDRFIYIFEFKVDKSPEKALEQIDEKHYADPYIADGRTVVKVGVEFSTAERNIRGWRKVMV